MEISSKRKTIHIDNNTSISRLIKNGVIKYKNQCFAVYEQFGKYRIDIDRPVTDALDMHSEDDILKKAEQILTRRHQREPSLFLESPTAFKTLIQARIAGIPHEVFDVAHLDNRHRLIDFQRCSIGTIDSASAYTRTICRGILERNSAAIACLHQHPSGVAEPSRSDVQITKRIKTAIEYLDCRLLDHFIVTNGSVVSLAERGEI